MSVSPLSKPAEAGGVSVSIMCWSPSAPLSGLGPLVDGSWLTHLLTVVETMCEIMWSPAVIRVHWFSRKAAGGADTDEVFCSPVCAGSS